MRLRLLRAALYLLGAGALGTGADVMRWPGRPSVESRGSKLADNTGDGRGMPPESLDVVRARDPFRLARSPAPVAYDPILAAEPAAPEQPPPPKPLLILSGILWATEPSAVLEGIPGVEGPRLMRIGDTLGGLRVQRIRESGVEVRGYDTSWVLGVRKPW